MILAAAHAFRKFVLFLAVAMGIGIFAVTESRYPSGGKTHELIEWFGIVLIVACILGRTWASLYIGGRKNDEMVTIGPYSIMRNPLYFFSILGAIGVGAQLGSVALALIFGALACAVFFIVVLHEEKLLLRQYGGSYRVYLSKVPRLLPKPSLWRDTPILAIRPPRVLMTFADALMFLLAVPLAELFEALQQAGIIPILLVLP